MEADDARPPESFRSILNDLRELITIAFFHLPNSAGSGTTPNAADRRVAGQRERLFRFHPLTELEPTTPRRFHVHQDMERKFRSKIETLRLIAEKAHQSSYNMTDEKKKLMKQYFRFLHDSQTRPATAVFGDLHRRFYVQLDQRYKCVTTSMEDMNNAIEGCHTQIDQYLASIRTARGVVMPKNAIALHRTLQQVKGIAESMDIDYVLDKMEDEGCVSVQIGTPGGGSEECGIHTSFIMKTTIDLVPRSRVHDAPGAPAHLGIIRNVTTTFVMGDGSVMQENNPDVNEELHEILARQDFQTLTRKLRRIRLMEMLLTEHPTTNLHQIAAQVQSAFEQLASSNSGPSSSGTLNSLVVTRLCEGPSLRFFEIPFARSIVASSLGSLGSPTVPSSPLVASSPSSPSSPTVPSSPLKYPIEYVRLSYIGLRPRWPNGVSVKSSSSSTTTISSMGTIGSGQAVPWNSDPWADIMASGGGRLPAAEQQPTFEYEFEVFPSVAFDRKGVQILTAHMKRLQTSSKHSNYSAVEWGDEAFLHLGVSYHALLNSSLPDGELVDPSAFNTPCKSPFGTSNSTLTRQGLLDALIKAGPSMLHALADRELATLLDVIKEMAFSGSPHLSPLRLKECHSIMSQSYVMALRSPDTVREQTKRFQFEMELFSVYVSTIKEGRPLLLIAQYANHNLIPYPYSCSEEQDRSVVVHRPWQTGREVDKPHNAVGPLATPRSVWTRTFQVMDHTHKYVSVAKNDTNESSSTSDEELAVSGVSVGSRGFQVGRVFLQDLSSLPGIVTILRRYVLFNRLYQSLFGPPCFLPPQNKLPQHTAWGEGGSTREFEVKASPPYRIRLAALTSCSTKAAQVGGDAVVVAVDSGDEGHGNTEMASVSQLCSFQVNVYLEKRGKLALHDYGTKVLRNCYSVPVLMRYLIQKQLFG